MLADRSYTVVQHAGQGLVVLPESAFRNVLQSISKLPGAKDKPKVHLLDGAEIAKIRNLQRTEVAEDLPVREGNFARPRQGIGIVRDNNRRATVLRILARSSSGMTRDQIGELGSMQRSTVYSMMLRLLKLGLVANVEGAFPKRVMITAAGRRLI
jgi:hypothetical protein